MLLWLVMNLAILHMVCLIIYNYVKSSFISVMSVGNTYENGWTNEKYPFIFTSFGCSGSETRLSFCGPSVTSNIQHCSSKEIVKLRCKGNL